MIDLLEWSGYNETQMEKDEYIAAILPRGMRNMPPHLQVRAVDFLASLALQSLSEINQEAKRYTVKELANRMATEHFIAVGDALVGIQEGMARGTICRSANGPLEIAD